MKGKDILAAYEMSRQEAIKLINTIRLVITELKGRVKLLKESKRPIKEKQLSRGQALSL